jgi:FdhE protein
VSRETNRKILDKLKEQEGEEGNLPLLLKFYRELLQIQSGVHKHIGTPRSTLSDEVLRKRTQNGLPLLHFDDLALDWSLVRDVFVKVITAFSNYPQLFGDNPEKLKKAGSDRLLTKKLVKAWFTGKNLTSTIRDSINENFMQAIIQATLQPFLSAYAAALMSSVEQDNWRHGYCPICGGSPDFAFLEKQYGARWLLCSRCDSEWLFQRLECPFCGTREQKALSFFTDDKEMYRLYVCENCKCYLKAIDLRKSESEILLPLERLYTIDLDSQAKEYGYSPCQKPAAKRR